MIEKLSVACQQEAAKRAPRERIVLAKEPPERLVSLYRGRKYFVRTYGCQGNVRDGETMAGLLSSLGMEEAKSEKEASIAVINTCAVRENAEEKIFGEIGLYKENAEKDDSFMLVIAGCAMAIDGFAQELMERYPWVRLVISTHEVGELLVYLDKALDRRLIAIHSFRGEVVEGTPVRRLDPYKAYVNISYGCDKFCTYCIVPYARGRERSRDKDDILFECRQLVKDGYKEITLLGQNVNSYGLDRGDGYLFSDLLRDAAKTGIPRLRFLTSYPTVFNREMAEAIRDNPNICHALHFPVQSGSTSCLRRMGRRYSREEYLERLSEIRSIVPDIAVSTDIIVGFPGESEEEFEDTLSLVKKARYASAFTFIYSPRPGTPAAKMEQVPSEISHERFLRLKDAVEASTSEYASTFVGKTVEVLVDGPSKKDGAVLSGYTREGKLVNFPGPAYLRGCILPVKILESKTFHLRGELAIDPVEAKAKDVAYLFSLIPSFSFLSKTANNPKLVSRLREIDEKLRASQKKMALAMSDREAHEAAKEEYLSLVSAIESDPLAVNYAREHSRLGEEIRTLKEIVKG